MNNFYVYVYLDPRRPGLFSFDSYCFDFEPFYIGKGKEKRFLGKLQDAKRGEHGYLYNKIRKILRSGLVPLIFKIGSSMPDCLSSGKNYVEIN